MEPREAKAVIEALAAALVWEQDQAKEIQKDFGDTQSALADEYGRSAELLAERDEARRKLAKAWGHNDLLRNQNIQLKGIVKSLCEQIDGLGFRSKTALRIAQADANEADIEAEVRAEMRGDHSDPDLMSALSESGKDYPGELRGTATEPPEHLDPERLRTRVAAAKSAQRIHDSAVREADKEYTEVVQDAKRNQERAIARIEADYTERMTAIERRDRPPAHLDTEREGAPAAAMAQSEQEFAKAYAEVEASMNPLHIWTRTTKAAAGAAASRDNDE